MADEDAKEQKLKDYSDLVKEKVPEYLSEAESKNVPLNTTLENLLNLEKKTRLAGDAPSTATVAVAIVQLLYDRKEWKMLNDYIQLIIKRRAQLKKPMQDIIVLATGWVDKTPDLQTKRELIETLRSVAAGKMFVELESARLTKTLGEMEEAEGKLQSAADILQEVQVETIGSMEIKEKANFLLEQIRLCLAVKDYVRAEIINKKVNTDVLLKPEMQDLKLRHNRLLIEFFQHSNNYFAICKAYNSIFNTPKVQESDAEWKDALHNAVIYGSLAPRDSESADMLERLKAEKKLASLPVYKALLDMFTTNELMKWPIPGVDPELRADAVFSQAGEGAKRYEDLRKRVIQHNIRTIAMYYHRITFQRLANLLSLPLDETERELSELVSSKQLFAKVDRPVGIVTFTRKQTPNSVINDWSRDVSDLLSLVEKTCHLINKENMIHKAAAPPQDDAAMRD